MTRVAAFIWVQSLIRDELKRSTRYGLDVALQELSAKADARLLAPLHGHYHNLVRCWADP